jgi:prepilin-type N-terminal cleavage/methylation domain-containing protein
LKGSEPKVKQGNAQRLGFSLLEISIVLLIVGALLVSGMAGLSTQSTKNQREKNRLYLESIRDSLIWYAKSRGRLPCPDTDGDGLGNLTGSACTQLVGVLPWKDLEAPNDRGLDVWGNYFTYHIGEAYASGAIQQETGTSADLTCVIAANKHCVIHIRETEVAGTLLAEDVPAAVVSHGKNGLGRFRFVAAALVREPADVNTIANLPERENADGVAENADANENIIYLRGAGDDMPIWLSQAALKSQL